MKSLIQTACLSIVLAIATTMAIGQNLVYAQDSEQNLFEANTIDVLHYHPGEKTYYTSLNVVTTVANTEDVWSGGVKATHYERNIFASTINVEYGWSDNLEFGISEQYLFNNGTKVTTESNGTTVNQSSSGFSDPTIEVNYRFLGGLTGKKFASAYLNFTPSIGDHQNASATSDGNNIAADSAVALGANFYWVTGAHEWEASPWVHYFSSGTNYVSGGTSYDNDSYINYGANGYYRYHFSSRYYLALAIELYAPFSQKYNHSSFSESVDNAFQAAEAITFGWKCVDTWLVTASLSNNTFTQSTSFTNGTQDQSLDNQLNNLTITGVHIF